MPTDNRCGVLLDVDGTLADTSEWQSTFSGSVPELPEQDNEVQGVTMNSLPQSARDHFRNLGREHGRRLAEQGQQSTQASQDHR